MVGIGSRKVNWILEADRRDTEKASEKESLGIDGRVDRKFESDFLQRWSHGILSGELVFEAELICRSIPVAEVH